MDIRARRKVGRGRGRGKGWRRKAKGKVYRSKDERKMGKFIG